MSTTNYQASRAGTDDVQVFDTNNTDAPHTSRIRGGAVWGGVAVGFGTLLLLEMILLTTGMSGGTLHTANSSGGSFAWDAIAAVIAFFMGGLVAGSSSPHRDTGSGALNGIVVWAVVILGTLILSGAIGGAVFGALSQVLASQQQTIQNSANQAQLTQQAVDTFRDAAGWAALSGALTLAAAAIGGAVGSKIWPHRNNQTSTRR